MECSPPTGIHNHYLPQDVLNLITVRWALWLKLSRCCFRKADPIKISNEETDKLSHRSKREMMDDWERGVNGIHPAAKIKRHHRNTRISRIVRGLIIVWMNLMKSILEH